MVGKVALLCMEAYMLRRKVQPQIEGHILYVPIYMIMCVKEKKMTDTIYSIKI